MASMGIIGLKRKQAAVAAFLQNKIWFSNKHML